MFATDSEDLGIINDMYDFVHDPIQEVYEVKENGFERNQILLC